MVEYFEKLIEEKKFQEALGYAEHILLNRDATREDLVAVNCGLTICRVQLDEFHGATVSGQLAIKFAKDAGEWDYYGTACLWLGVALDRLNQSEGAAAAWYDFLAHVERYTVAREYEAVVRYNLGVLNSRRGHGSEAVLMFTQALSAADRNGNERHSHGIRQALMLAYIQMGQFDQIPRLLAITLRFLRNHEHHPEIQKSWMWHFRHRAEFAIRTNRLTRAKAVALRGIQKANGNYEHLFQFYITLSRVSQLSGNMKDAMGYILTARVCAMRCRRYDLESEAASLMYDLTINNPNVLQEIGHEYTALLVDYPTYSRIRH